MGQNTNIDYSNLMTLIIDGLIYNRVIKVDLSSTSAFSNNWPLPSLNYLYFEINKGIIGFDDKQGNEWRIK